VLPAVEKIGVGWFSTISAGFLVVSALGAVTAVMWGRGWREGIDRKRRAKRGKMAEGEAAKVTPLAVDGGKEKEMV
jgi:hypothetical protein